VSGYSSIALLSNEAIEVEGALVGTSPSSTVTSSSSDEDCSLAGLGATRDAGGVTWRDGGGGRLFNDEVDPLEALRVIARALGKGWPVVPVSRRTGGREGSSGAPAPFALISLAGIVRCLAGRRGGCMAGLSAGRLVDVAGRFGGTGGGQAKIWAATSTDSSGSAVQSAWGDSDGVVTLLPLVAESPEARVKGGGNVRGGTAGLGREGFDSAWPIISVEDGSEATLLCAGGVCGGDVVFGVVTRDAFPVVRARSDADEVARLRRGVTLPLLEAL